MSNDAQKQIYDNLLKRLIEHQYETIIPLLFPMFHPTTIREQTIEALLPPRRMDKVYQIDTSLGEVIFHIEIEASAKKSRGSISRRMLLYHASLLDKYNERDEGIPVITFVVYPFEVPAGEPRFVETYGDAELLRFPYHELLLRSLDARDFMKAQAVPLYGLLPAMSGVSEELINQAIEDVVNYYAKDDDLKRDELWCLLVLLRRGRPLPELELNNVLRRIRMYDPLLREDPLVQEYMSESEVKGKAEGFRTSIERVVRRRFPDLKELAMERVAHIQDLDTLEQVLDNLLAAPDERHALRYLQAL